MKTKYALFLKLIGSLFALVLLAAPSLGVAQITITQVKVLVGGGTPAVAQDFCDTTTTCTNPNDQIWNLGGGVTLNPGQTLILTQTGVMVDAAGNVLGGNFDTSDRGRQLTACTTGNPCNVQVLLNINGGGLTSVYNSAAPVALNNFNIEPTASPSPSHNETAGWGTVVTTSTYTLGLGYADNEHTDQCPGGPATPACFPQSVFGTGGATFFIGAGLSPGPSREACGDATHPLAPAPGGGCYDAGAMLITALAPAQGCTPGFWKNHTDEWVGFSPNQLVSSVFTIPGSLSSLGQATLLQALSFQGGSGVNGAAQILLRAAVSALLNSTANIGYPLTTAQVINQVNAALATLDRATILALATTLDTDNNLVCPLN